MMYKARGYLWVYNSDLYRSIGVYNRLKGWSGNARCLDRRIRLPYPLLAVPSRFDFRPEVTKPVWTSSCSHRIEFKSRSNVIPIFCRKKNRTRCNFPENNFLPKNIFSDCNEIFLESNHVTEIGGRARILDSKEKEVTGSNLGTGNRTNELIYLDWPQSCILQWYNDIKTVQWNNDGTIGIWCVKQWFSGKATVQSLNYNAMIQWYNYYYCCCYGGWVWVLIWWNLIVLKGTKVTTNTVKQYLW